MLLRLKNRLLTIAIALISISSLASGCNEGGNPTGVIRIVSSPPRPTNFEGVTPLNVLAAVRRFNLINQNLGIPKLPNLELEIGSADAIFRRGSPTAVLVVANNVIHNLSKNRNSFHSFPDFSIIAPGLRVIGINYTGPAVFSVDGYPLTANTITVPSRITIINLEPNAILTKNSGFSLFWTGVDDGKFWQAFLIDSQGNYRKKEGITETSATFSSSELSGLANGAGFVIVRSYNFSFTNSNETVLVGESISTVSVLIQ